MIATHLKFWKNTRKSAASATATAHAKKQNPHEREAKAQVLWTLLVITGVVIVGLQQAMSSPSSSHSSEAKSDIQDELKPLSEANGFPIPASDRFPAGTDAAGVGAPGSAGAASTGATVDSHVQ